MAQPFKGLIPSAEFLKDYEPPDYLVDGIIQRGYLYSMTGLTGSGKTAVALALTAHIALGMKLAGLEVQQGAVVYLAGENYTDIQQRWASLAKEMGFDPAKVPVLFHPGPMSIVENRVLMEGAVVREIGQVACFIADTHVAFFTGDNENDNLQQQVFADHLRALCEFPGKPAVIVPSHPAKNTRRTTMPRGGGAFLNAVDGNLTVSKRDGTSHTRLHWAEKFRGPPFEPIRFQLVVTDGPMKDSRGKFLPTVVAKAISQAEAQALDSASQADDMILLDACRGNPTLNYPKLADAVGWYTTHGQPDRDRVFRVMKRLVDSGLCKFSGKKGRYGVGWALTDATSMSRPMSGNVDVDLSDVEEDDDY